ncbi:glycosyltransferase family 4 protein [Defluviitalea raffinosedens]|uniref:glycosyltransferase family 4 protein n=1 Tax=Defluviitalea raffinosedens TaxID=1450156 RepID=UPI00176EE130|nr:glycosyltransferase involved in cell wall biosynthesis [Defluviitalea raffinosedens]HHW68390.1 glycosyltransferase family 4 protein [Candidatus Epulonipiscium sp.]
MKNQSVLLVLEFDLNEMMTQRPHHLINYLKNTFKNVVILYFNKKLYLKNQLFDFEVIKEQEDNITYISIPYCKHYDAEKKLLINSQLMKHYILNNFTNRNFDICIFTNPLSAPLVESIKKENVAKVLVYEDLDDFTQYYSLYSPEITSYMELCEGYMLDNADVIFSVSESLKDYRIGQGHTNVPIYISPNGVILKNFNCSSNSTREDKIIFIGALEEWAGVQFAIRGLKQCIDRGFKTEFIIVGEGLYEKELMQLTKDLNIEQYVKFLGRLEHNKLPELMNRCKVGIITFEESNLTKVAHPIKIIEYFACGLAVIGSDFGEIKNAIDESGAGLTVGNEEEFADAVIKLLTDHNFYIQCQKNSRKYAEEFDWTRIFDNEFTIISEVRPKTRVNKLNINFEEVLQEFEMTLNSNGQDEFSLSNLFNSLEKEWVRKGYKKAAIYGAGEHTERLLKHISFENMEIGGLIDSNPKYLGQSRYGYKIISFQNAIEQEVDVIIISSRKYEEEIYNMIKNECSKNHIEIFKLYKENKEYEDQIWRQLYIEE